MTSPAPNDWQSRFRNFKIDLDAARSKDRSLNQIDVDATGFGSETLQHGYQQLSSWFQGIPASGKVCAIAVGGLLSLTLIKTVFQLVSSLITLSVFGVILYLIYRFWIAPKSTD